MWGQQSNKGSSTWNAYVAFSGDSGATWTNPIDISNNAVGVAAGNQDVTLFGLSSNGVDCFATWTFSLNGISQVVLRIVLDQFLEKGLPCARTGKHDSGKKKSRQKNRQNVK